MKTKEIFEFGPFRLVPAERLLLRDSSPVTLTPKVFDLLVVLVKNRGALLEREELLKTLWPDSFIEENNLTVNVSTLRRVLGEAPSQGQYIETVPKKGYRFAADVRALPEASPALERSLARVEPQTAEAPSTTAKPWSRPRYVAAAAVVLACLAAAGFVKFASPDPALPLEALPLTAYPGMEDSPTASPDGSRVAFVWYPPGHTTPGIYVKLIGPGDAVRLTDAHSACTDPAWSPDGTQIAYLHESAPGKSEVLIMPAVGGATRKLADIVPPLGMLGPILNWSPDGKHLLMSSADPLQAPLRIYAVSLETGQRRAISFPPPASVGDSQPSLSPDGRTLLFARNVTKTLSDLWSVAISPADMTPRGNPTRITFLQNQAGGAAWTPNGREIIFSAGPPLGGSRLFRLPADHPATYARLQPIPYIGVDGIEPVITRPNAQNPGRLIYEKFSFLRGIRRLGLRGGKPAGESIPWAPSTRMDESPDISPDGNRVAFASTRSGGWEIWTCDTAGTNCMQLTHFGSSYTRMPRWSPDGTRIVFDSRIRGNADLYVIEAGGGNPRQLTFEPSNEFNPAWSRDGRFLYFASNRTGEYRIFKMPASGGTAVQLSQNAGDAPHESRDGKWVYFRGPTGGIRRVPADGGPDEAVLPNSQPGLALALGKSGIYYGIFTPEPKSLRYTDLATGNTRELFQHALLDGNGLAVSPDETWLLHVQSVEPGSDLMYVDNFR